MRGPDAPPGFDHFSQRHGYLFEVPVGRGPEELEKGEPLRAAGRFAHEAAAVDQRTGVVYETEDPGSGRGAGFYRFLPEDPCRLTKGGRLQMLAVSGRPQLDMRQGQQVGKRLEVTWVDIDDPDPEQTGVNDLRGTFFQGYAKGGALFNRLEGCWEDGGSIFFVSTSGGDAKSGDVNSDGYQEGFGQVWEYRPWWKGGVLRLVYESARRGPGGLARQSHRDAPRRLDHVRGRRVVGESGHPSAGARHLQRQPGDRPRPARRAVRGRGERPQRV